jgi:D-glycero-D-manno-heptose 1,7-bisphosphate phosphatase
MKRAIFLDRDGTLILDKEYLHRPEEVEFYSGSIEALRCALDAGFVLIMVTNQSGVGRGYFTLDDVHKVHAHIEKELAHGGVTLMGIYVAPEAPEMPSHGRKPSPQFLFDARDDFGIDLARSYMVGDKMSDLQCGWNAGVRKSILVRTGEGKKTEAKQRDELRDAAVVEDLAEAIEWILKRDRA